MNLTNPAIGTDFTAPSSKGNVKVSYQPSECRNSFTITQGDNVIHLDATLIDTMVDVMNILAERVDQ